MRAYSATLIGKTELLHHYDNIDWADEMAAWKDNPTNKPNSKAGDDRTPAWRWLGALYHDGNVVAIPGDNLMVAFREGGAMVPVPGGRSGKTFKSQTQSGMLCGEQFWPLSVSIGGAAPTTIPVAPLLALQGERDFKAHKEFAKKAGFDLFVKRARVNSSKHIRVRPIFSGWQCTGTVHVMDDQITTAVLEDILTYAGRYKGLGDWRPGGKTPGPFGVFTAKVKLLN